jgi:YD repeat-containing protein
MVGGLAGFDSRSATDGWTLTYKDSSGRTVSVGRYSGSAQPAPFGSSSSAADQTQYSYNGATTTITEEDGKARQQTHDPLGRLVGVVEAATTSSAATTSYNYDSLGNLTGVMQNVTGGVAGQTRSFVYSSLSRLTQANNPETGAINYTYFPNGALKTKADARNTISYQYDGLSRIISKSYTGVDSTPNVTYCYDGTTSQPGGGCQSGAPVSNSIGRLTSVSNASTATSGTTTLYLGYDAEGRVLSSSQQTDGIAFSPFQYQYTPGGALKQIQYPSGRVVSYGFDTMGRTNVIGRGSAAPTVTAATPSNAYAWGMAYQPSGQLQGLQYGTTNNRFETWGYNFRQQAVTMQLGSASAAGDVWQLQNDYGADGANNGNVRWQYLTPSATQVISTAYLYDAFNRLSVADEKAGTAINSLTATCPDAGSTWCFQYQYDAYGNRLIVQRAGSGSGVALSSAIMSGVAGWFTASGEGHSKKQTLTGREGGHLESDSGSEPQVATDGAGARKGGGPSEPYNRRKHYGSTPTEGDREAIGGESVDHAPPLVKRFYDGDPATGEKPVTCPH